MELNRSNIEKNQLEEAKYLYYRQNLEDAIEKCDLLLKRNENNLDAYILKGDILIMLKKSKEAQYIYQIACNLSSNQEQILILKGKICYCLEIIEFAYANLYDAIQSNQNCSLAYFWIAYFLFLEKKYDQAIVNFKKALEINPVYFECQTLIGISLYLLDQKLKSLEYFNQSILQYKNQYLPYFYKGQVLLFQEKYQEAITYFDLAIDISALKSEAYYQKGICFMKQQMFTQALECFDLIIQLNNFEFMDEINQKKDFCIFCKEFINTHERNKSVSKKNRIYPLEIQNRNQNHQDQLIPFIVLEQSFFKDLLAQFVRQCVSQYADIFALITGKQYKPAIDYIKEGYEQIPNHKISVETIYTLVNFVIKHSQIDENQNPKVIVLPFYNIDVARIKYDIQRLNLRLRIREKRNLNQDNSYSYLQRQRDRLQDYLERLEEVQSDNFANTYSDRQKLQIGLNRIILVRCEQSYFKDLKYEHDQRRHGDEIDDPESRIGEFPYYSNYEQQMEGYRISKFAFFFFFPLGFILLMAHLYKKVVDFIDDIELQDLFFWFSSVSIEIQKQSQTFFMDNQFQFDRYRNFIISLIKNEQIQSDERILEIENLKSIKEFLLSPTQEKFRQIQEQSTHPNIPKIQILTQIIQNYVVFNLIITIIIQTSLIKTQNFDDWNQNKIIIDIVFLICYIIFQYYELEQLFSLNSIINFPQIFNLFSLTTVVNLIQSFLDKYNIYMKYRFSLILITYNVLESKDLGIASLVFFCLQESVNLDAICTLQKSFSRNESRDQEEKDFIQMKGFLPMRLTNQLLNQFITSRQLGFSSILLDYIPQSIILIIFKTRQINSTQNNQSNTSRLTITPLHVNQIQDIQRKDNNILITKYYKGLLCFTMKILKFCKQTKNNLKKDYYSIQLMFFDL
ncbi:hypothetical protein ABPG73_013525 [Tetrahymena malaccensis]